MPRAFHVCKIYLEKEMEFVPMEMDKYFDLRTDEYSVFCFITQRFIVMVL